MLDKMQVIILMLSLSVAGCALDPEQESTEIQEISYEPSLVYSGIINYSTGLSGTSRDYLVGNWCPTAFLRSYVDSYVFNANGGHCEFIRWYSNDSSDCRAIVHLGAGSFKHGSCAWQIYADQVFYVSFQASDTSNAQQNTIDTDVPLSAGRTLTIGTCGLPGVSGTGDTYIRLIEPNGLTAAINDDSCGLLSRMVFTVPPGGDGVYTIKAGCYSSGSCGGTLGWSVK